VKQEEEQEQQKRHGGGGGLVPKTAKNSGVGMKQQYRPTESAKKQQKTRDSKITATLLQGPGGGDPVHGHQECYCSDSN
jgi:hypothetical protein